MIFRKENLKLPNQVTPCPIVDTSCEIRFSSPFPDDAVFGASFAKLVDLVGAPAQLPILQLPAEIRGRDAALRHQPYYRFEKDGFVVQLGPRTFSVGSNVPYPGWAKFSAAIKSRVQAITSSGVVGKVERFGLRYINFIDGDVFDKIDVQMSVNGSQMRGREMSVTLIVEDRYSHMVRIRKDVNVKWNGGRVSKFGSIVDIDSYFVPPGGELSKFDTFLEEAHLDEKTIFFGMLKPDYLATLNPV